MKVMIDIPDHIYGMVVNSGTFGCYRFKTTAAIKKGIAFSDDDTNSNEEKNYTVIVSFTSMVKRVIKMKGQDK